MQEATLAERQQALAQAHSQLDTQQMLLQEHEQCNQGLRQQLEEQVVENQASLDELAAIRKRAKALEQEKRASIVALEQVERQVTAYMDAEDYMHAQLKHRAQEIDRWPGRVLCLCVVSSEARACNVYAPPCSELEVARRLVSLHGAWILPANARKRADSGMKSSTARSDCKRQMRRQRRRMKRAIRSRRAPASWSAKWRICRRS